MLKDDFWKAMLLIDNINGHHQLNNLVCLPAKEPLFDVELVKDGFDGRFSLGRLHAVIVAQYLKLRGVDQLQRFDGRPGALSVDDVGAELAGDGRLAEAVEEVVLGLKVN